MQPMLTQISRDPIDVQNAIEQSRIRIQNALKASVSEPTLSQDTILSQQANFEAIVGITTDRFNLVAIPTHKTPSYQLRKKRRDFHDGLRRQMRINAANYHPGQFREMGLEEEELKKLAQTGTIPSRKQKGLPPKVTKAGNTRNRKKAKLDITIEHLWDLQYGGENQSWNLQIVPGYINTLAANFLALQYIDETTQSAVSIELSDKGCKHGHPKVPFVTGGFRPDMLDSRVTNDRIDEFLGLELQR